MFSIEVTIVYYCNHKINVFKKNIKFTTICSSLIFVSDRLAFVFDQMQLIDGKRHRIDSENEV